MAGGAKVGTTAQDGGKMLDHVNCVLIDARHLRCHAYEGFSATQFEPLFG